MYYSDGSMAPVYACVRDPAYLQFVHDWIDTVKWLGATTIFWDEPHMPTKTVGDKRYFGCACPNCRRAFEERFNRPMPEVVDDDVEEFQAESIAEYFRDITAYSASQGIVNSVCVMLGTFGMSLAAADKICAIPTVDNIGSDPYWVGGETPVYKYVYDGARRNIEMCERFGKDHNIWIQTFNNPRGSEEDIILATEGAYDAGARCLLAWGFYGSESNDYHAKNPLRTWEMTKEAMRRVRSMERDRILEEKRKLYMK
jgi:hypothetical protein